MVNRAFMMCQSCLVGAYAGSIGTTASYGLLLIYLIGVAYILNLHRNDT